MTLLETLLARPPVSGSPIARELAVVMTCPVYTSTAGYPYLQRSSWTRLRDWVPHILAAGPPLLDAARTLVDEARACDADADALANLESSLRVVRQVVFTAAVTAPPDLWLLRHVLAGLDRVGISDRLLAGETVRPADCAPLVEAELRIDLRFLLARGYLVRTGDGLRLLNADVARRVVDELRAGARSEGSESLSWAAAAGTGNAALPDVAAPLPERSTQRGAGRWQATPWEIELGSRLVPLVLGLRVAERVPALLERETLTAEDLCPAAPEAGGRALAILTSAGVVDAAGRLGDVGRRVLSRGPGPFGIIEAYHPYMARLDEILTHGRGAISVRRGANIAASQDANRRTFEKAHDALDRFSQETGFTYDVFVEHAVGRGEATRQRWERSGDAPIRYFGADLEDAAVDAAVVERDRGVLPPGMLFIRNADIGAPQVVVNGVRAAGAATEGAVMVVGNGFHEIRDQTDDAMTRVFADYERAGFLLIFTEESALPVDALLDTAWNTYHAGFRYVHERSGQGLRPAEPGPPSRFEGRLPASWSECAGRAGYVRADAYCTRTRTIYPYTPATGHNPSISVNHFFVPGRRDGGTPMIRRPSLALALLALTTACSSALPPPTYVSEIPPGSGTWVEVPALPVWTNAPPPREGFLRFVASGKSNLRSIAATGRNPRAGREAAAAVSEALVPVVGEDAAARAAEAVPDGLQLVHRACKEELLTRDMVPGNTLCTAWALWEIAVDDVVAPLDEGDRKAARAALGH